MWETAPLVFEDLHKAAVDVATQAELPSVTASTLFRKNSFAFLPGRCKPRVASENLDDLLPPSPPGEKATPTFHFLGCRTDQLTFALLIFSAMAALNLSSEAGR
jgi:hypothetical protein